MSEDALCTCGHWDPAHARGGDYCRGIDSYGLPCDCPSFERDPWPDDEESDDG